MSDPKAMAPESFRAGDESTLALLRSQIERAIRVILVELAQSKGLSSHWTGQLSSSALSTATAISALANCPTRCQSDSIKQLIDRGASWLAQTQNDDGGFGDTDRSLSNIATTLLVLAAWKITGKWGLFTERVDAARSYVERQGGWDGLRKRYGKDKTFVVPIMANCAIAGLIDWRQIPTLPFEAAALPQSWYRFAQMPVVSYAIPALVAIGQAQFVHAPPRNPLSRCIRSLCRKRTLDILLRMQPQSGGYLEATPLTSFVLMSLASIGLEDHPIAASAIRFLKDSVSPDGSWPIDTNLATWVTSLTTSNYYDSSHADFVPPLTHSQTLEQQCSETIEWILSCQHRVRHPFTGAEPGGWGWTDLSGSVPDADDTPAALLVIADYVERYPDKASRIMESAHAGCRWLIRLQNRDGGWPTFCRGWGKLPFDRSGADLTAHAIRALFRWRSRMPIDFQVSIDRALAAGWSYLRQQQNSDGSWMPLWFGNQDRVEEDNPYYGTARVLLAYADCQKTDQPIVQRAIQFLMQSQNPDGGWGGGPSIRYPAQNPNSSDSMHPCEGSSTVEETAIVLDGIMACGRNQGDLHTIMRGLDWLTRAILQGKHQTSQPIGFYFAKLWYHERLYPLAFSLSALRKGLEFCQR